MLQLKCHCIALIDTLCTRSNSRVIQIIEVLLKRMEAIKRPGAPDYARES